VIFVPHAFLMGSKMLNGYVISRIDTSVREWVFRGTVSRILSYAVEANIVRMLQYFNRNMVIRLINQ
jgi:hypothetical protein